jgi:hypothetical protein
MSTFKDDTIEVSINFLLKFNITSIPKLEVTDSSIATVEGENQTAYVFVRVTRPDGIVREPDMDNPDMTIVFSSVPTKPPESKWDYTLPLSSSDGRPSEGVYRVDYLFRVGSDSDITTRSKEIDFSFDYKTLTCINLIDEFTPSVKVRDTTEDYTVTNYSLRSIERTFESSNGVGLDIDKGDSGGFSEEDRTFDLADQEGKYQDSTYTTYIDVVCEHQHIEYDWFSVNVKLSKTITTEVFKAPTRAELLSFIDTIRNLMDTYINYNDTLYAKYSKDYEFVVSSFQHFEDRLSERKTGQDTTEILRDMLDVIRNDVPRTHTNEEITPVDITEYIPSVDWDQITNIPVYNPFATYEKKFPIPKLEWEVIHSLNKKPTVTLVDDYENIVYGAVEYVNLNIIKITFNTLTSGKVYIN